MLSNKTWDALSTVDNPTHFSRFPAGIAHNASDVVATLNKLIDITCTPGSKEERKARLRHQAADKDPFAICHCTSIPERLVLVSSIAELLWIHNDVTEELEHKQACIKHDILKDSMSLEKLVNAEIGQFNARETIFGLLVQKACAMDPKAAPKMVDTLSNFFQTYNSSDEEFVSMDTYIPYRVAQSGYWTSSYLIRWGMDLTLSDEEIELIKDFDFSMGAVMGLTNDYFSWNVEKDRETDRVRNAVRVLMTEYQVPDRVAKAQLKEIILDEEEKACRAKHKVLESYDSPPPKISEYFEAIELYIGGCCYWHTTAPCYRV